MEEQVAQPRHSSGVPHGERLDVLTGHHLPDEIVPACFGLSLGSSRGAMHLTVEREPCQPPFVLQLLGLVGLEPRLLHFCLPARTTATREHTVDLCTRATYQFLFVQPRGY